MAAVVLLIWGIVIYKAFFQKDESLNEDIVLPVNKEIVQDVSTTNYVLIADYKDPFLKANVRVQDNKSVPKVLPKKIEPKVVVKKIIVWPSVQYKGLISAKQTMIGLVFVNNKQFLARKNDLVDGLTVLQLFPDSVITSYENEKKTFVKK